MIKIIKEIGVKNCTQSVILGAFIKLYWELYYYDTIRRALEEKRLLEGYFDQDGKKCVSKMA